jgi:molybdate transport system regulatory protein
MPMPPLSSALTLGRGPTGRVGADRIALVEAIGEEGSITRAAKRLGISYRAAWDGVQALNNLFDEPLVTASTGGATGGAASLTARGRKLIVAYRTMEARLAEAWAMVGDGATDIWSLGMKTSARNAFRGVVDHITEGEVNCEVTLKVAEGIDITAIVTRASVEDLGLAVGGQAIALIKASFVILAVGKEPLRTSARNQLSGKVETRTDGAVSSEVAVSLAAGKTLIATLTRESAEELDLKPGDSVTALIKAPHVILAVE